MQAHTNPGYAGASQHKASLPECIAALLERLGQGRPAFPGGQDGAGARLSHLDALELLERHGCCGEWRYGRIEDIPVEQFPVILRCQDGAWCVLLAPGSGGRLRVAFPAPPDAPMGDCAGALAPGQEALYLVWARSAACAHGEHRHDPLAVAPHWYFGAIGLAGRDDA